MSEEAESRDYEAEARKEGWVSQEEWVDQGKDPDQWRPADEFVKRGEEISGFKIKRLERDLSEMKKSLQQQREESDRALKLQQEAYENELKDARAKAIESGDGRRVNELDDELYELRQKQQEAAKTPEPKNDPDAEEAIRNFYERNHSWYGPSGDAELTEMADGFGYSYAARNPGASAGEIVEYIEKKMKPKVRGKVEKKTAVEGASRGTKRNTKEKTYENLPKEAKEACDTLMNRIPPAQREKFKEKYVEGFSWE